MMDLSVALDKYYERFAENYPLCISMCRDDAEIVADIEQCINAGKKARQIEYEDGVDY